MLQFAVVQRHRRYITRGQERFSISFCVAQVNNAGIPLRVVSANYTTHADAAAAMQNHIEGLRAIQLKAEAVHLPNAQVI